MTGLLGMLRRWLAEPGTRGLGVDGLDFSLTHREVLMRKRMLRELFARFYHHCRRLDERYFAGCPGLRVEIGAGSSLIHKFYPDVLTSDVKPLPWVDRVFRAEEMPLATRSVRAIYGINVLHHLSRPRRFLAELERVLHPGGGAVLIEPYHGPVARLLFKHLHPTERFDTETSSWDSPDQVGPFANANQALSYLMFTRDREQFSREFPGLSLVYDQAHTHLWYLASGGVNFRQLAPSWSTPLLRWAEALLAPFDQWLALLHTIVLRRLGNPLFHTHRA
jgi:SAM-dependent methyltransferase